MKISVIIPTYNEEKVIENCLDSLINQTANDFEIIVVDDGSTDTTPEKIELFNKEKIKFYSQKHMGAGEARNFGAKYAKGEILVFVDADMTFDKSFLIKLTSPIFKKEAIGTFSKEEYVSNWENIWARCWNINQGWQDKRRHPKNYQDEQKVFRAIRASEFKKVNGFSRGGYTDDWSLSEKLGILAKNAKGATFYHSNPDNLVEVFNQAKWSAKREYKMGILGSAISIVRANIVFSLIIGLIKAFKYNNFSFVAFKIVYDLGTVFGILSYIITKQGFK